MGGVEAPARPSPSAARKRAAVETIAREGPELKRVARRFSLCTADAEDAYQRSLEILLLKAPDLRPRELGRWMRTVVKHEALAVRAGRERALGGPGPDDGGEAVARVAAPEEGPERRAEELEDVARSREALRRLKPAERRALALLAAGCSYAEIAEIAGFSRRKVQRSLVEGRDRFRRFLADGESGTRCAAMAPLLSAFCDGEASASDNTTVREHLRACAGCRATLRAYRAASAGAAVLLPAVPLSRTLAERAQELFAGLWTRLPGGGAPADAGVAQAATAGAGRGVGAAAVAKLLALCAGAAGSAACVATGVAPVPLDLGPPPAKETTIKRVAEPVRESVPAPVEYEPTAPDPVGPAPAPAVEPEAAQAAPQATPDADAGAVEFEPPPEPPPTGQGSGSAAGEFGP